jgi:hypothetical protein
VKSLIILDKKTLQANHPEEYSECMVEGKSTEALIIDPKIAARE